MQKQVTRAKISTSPIPSDTDWLTSQWHEQKKKRNHEAVTRFLSFIMWSVLSLAMFWSQAQSQQTLLAEMCPKCGHLSMYTTAGILINKCSNLILQKVIPLYVGFGPNVMQIWDLKHLPSGLSLIYGHDNQEKMQNHSCFLLFSEKEVYKSECKGCLWFLNSLLTFQYLL